MSIILPETSKLIRPLDRKTAVISFTKTLTDSRAFSEKYKKGWGYSCEAMLKLLENPPVPSTTTDDIHEQDVDDPSFGVGFTQLSTCRPVPRDPWPDVTDLKRWVGASLKESDRRLGGRVCFQPSFIFYFPFHPSGLRVLIPFTNLIYRVDIVVYPRKTVAGSEERVGLLHVEVNQI